MISEGKQSILITVKTYPAPQLRYREIVCTAGVLKDGTWVRLHPIPYRYLQYNEWYKKYQWITAEIKKHRGDPRPESYSVISKIKLGEIMSTKNKWERRKKLVLAKGTKTMCWLQQQRNITLSVIQLGQNVDFVWEETDREWNKNQANYMRQIHLFDRQSQKPLEKIPYIFKYHYHCMESGCNGHKMQVTDWEIMELFRKMRDMYGEKKALIKVKEKYIDQVCSPKRDTYFIVGTVFQYGTWIIIGVFWPPK
jgi:hypothetical protein